MLMMTTMTTIKSILALLLSATLLLASICLGSPMELEIAKQQQPEVDAIQRVGGLQSVGEMSGGASTTHLGSPPGAWMLYQSDPAAIALEPAQPVASIANGGQESRQRRQVNSLTEEQKKKNQNKKKKQNKKKPGKPKGGLTFESDCLNTHNRMRKLHLADALKWDDKLAAFAQKRADTIAKSDGAAFSHPPGLEFGENLAWHSRDTSTCAKLVQMWYDELSLYDFSRAKFDHETGHFTQLVWRETTRVGCARAFSSGPNGGVYLVCNYDPPGNFLGEERQNVLPLSRTANTSVQTEQPTTTTTEAATTTLATTEPTTTTAITTTTTSMMRSTSTTNSAPTVRPANNDPKRKKSNKKKNKKRKKKRNKNKNKKKTSTTTTTTTTSTTTEKPRAV